MSHILEIKKACLKESYQIEALKRQENQLINQMDELVDEMEIVYKGRNQEALRSFLCDYFGTTKEVLELGYLQMIKEKDLKAILKFVKKEYADDKSYWHSALVQLEDVTKTINWSTDRLYCFLD